MLVIKQLLVPVDFNSLDRNSRNSLQSQWGPETVLLPTLFKIYILLYSAEERMSYRDGTTWVSKWWLNFLGELSL